jgi:hypothetical protein
MASYSMELRAGSRRFGRRPSFRAKYGWRPLWTSPLCMMSFRTEWCDGLAFTFQPDSVRLADKK